MSFEKGVKIVHVKGTLNDETCFVHFYSNGVEIIIPPSSSTTEKTIIYEFEDISQLKIDSVIEEKKKFLHTSKTFYLKISIDYTNANEGTKTIPSIIVTESDYREIIKSVEEYIKSIEEHNRKIKEREEQEKRKREQRIKQESFKIEFIEALEVLSLVYNDMKTDSDAMQINLNMKISDTNLFYILVKEMHEKIGDTKSIDYASRILKVPLYAKALLEKTIYMNLSDWQGISLSGDKIIEVISGQLNLWLNSHIPDDYIYQKLICNDDKIKSTFDMLFDDIDSEESCDWKALRYFPAIYMFAYSFIKVLILFRNIGKFNDNTDLITMYKNLSENTSLDVNDISAKLYPIYKNHYANTFERLFSQLEFYSFMVIFDNCKNKISISIYDEEIEQFKKSLTKDAVDFSSYEYELLINKVQGLLLSIDNSKFFEYTGTPYDLNFKYINGAYILFYEYILKRIGNYLPSDVFFKLFSERRSEGTATLKKKQEDDVIQKEMERLLKGDLSKEKEQEYDKYSFDNITTGYEFEEYLKTIFERMGYDVEVTQKSNDQGGDLVIEKDGERTVVQAKFYSSPVGNKAVQEVVAAKSFYGANKGMIVTNSTYTNSAVALAEVNDITLIDGEELNRIRDAILETI